MSKYGYERVCTFELRKIRRTAVDDAVDIIKVSEPFENGNSNLSNDLDINWPVLLVDPVQRALVHVFHTDMNVWVGDKGTIEGDDVF